MSAEIDPHSTSSLLHVQVESKRYDGGPVAVRVSGELCTASVGELRTALDEAMADQPPAIMLDVSGVTFIDGRGLGLLLEVQRRQHERSAMLCLVHPSRAVRRLLELTATAETFDVATGG